MSNYGNREDLDVVVFALKQDRGADRGKAAPSFAGLGSGVIPLHTVQYTCHDQS
jgi:hypothetical protein